MDPITQKFLMASSAKETYPAPMVEDVFGVDVYNGFGAGYDSPFASGFTTNYGKDGYPSTYFPGNSFTGYLDFSDDSSFALANDFTIEMWVKGAYQPGTINLFQLDGPTGNTQHQNLQIRMQQAAGNISVMNTFNTDGNSNGIDLTGSTNLMDGNWHHICVMRYSNGTMTQFIDGNAEQYSTNGGTYFNPNGGSPRIRLGALSSGSQKYQGYISNFRITVGNCAYGNAGSDGITGFTPPSAPLTGGTMRALYSSTPFVHSMPYSQNLSITVQDAWTRVTTPRLLCEDINWTDGGMIWIKTMDGANGNRLYDTERDSRVYIPSDAPAEEQVPTPGGVKYWTEKGVGHTRCGEADHQNNLPEETSVNNKYVAWGFKKAKRFFDVIKWDGNNVNGRTIEHNLACTPGVIMVKCLGASYSWQVYHTSLSASGSNGRDATSWLHLDSSSSAQTSNTPGFNNVNSETFDVGSYVGCNSSGQKYIAYLFAHDDESDSIIKCGTYAGNSGANRVELGWEPQYVMIKGYTSTANWWIYDTQRNGLRTYNNGTMNTFDPSVGSLLYANSTQQEGSNVDIQADATGFNLPAISNTPNENGKNFAYIAIRLGPMRIPTDSETVFNADRGQAPNVPSFSAKFPSDVTWGKGYTASSSWNVGMRKQGVTGTRNPSRWDWITNAIPGSDPSYTTDMKGAWSDSAYNKTWMGYMMRRAPGFFDTVGYVGNQSSENPSIERAIKHNLGVKPEIIMVRCCGWDDPYGYAFVWAVKNCGNLPSTAASPYTGVNYQGYKNLGNIAGAASSWVTNANSDSRFGTSIDTTTEFYVGTHRDTNKTAHNYMALMWASCPGVSKVGYYVGTGSDENIPCGFTGSARFVLINKWDEGAWYVYDSVRGITDSDVDYLRWDSTDGQQSGSDYIDPYNGGFKVTNTANTTINVTGHYYTFIAIA